MPSRHAMRLLICSATSFLIAGCYGQGLYGPYRGRGFAPQQGYFSNAPYSQPQFLPQYPGSYTVPGGGVVVPPSEGTYAPGSPGTPIIQDDGWSETAAPPYNSGSDLGTGYGGDNGISYEGEPGNVPRPLENDEMFDSFGSAGSGLEATASAYRQPQVVTGNPIGSPPTGNQMYGHSRDFSWLRGIVTKARNGHCEITYDLKAPASDDYAGRFELVDNSLLKNIRNGDIVQISGQVDPGTTDPAGKPFYRVSSVKKIDLN